ncbi:hypothetical protein POF50_005270 [Streptomyces sp. SL13]|uniref:DUF2029 domain-containing protein n=1 Tax=Streptantibioticus silvisoli TaxID=2705255 RepID=A0AA90KF41_9ACTN|nr:hypothetical protein [Streptantibioticus silvisoli]MDI5968760.1 hypothetical protein [Streptantibioticus silvisoli]
MRLRTTVTAVLLTALVAVTAVTVLVGGTLGSPGRLPWWYAAGWALFAAAAWSVRAVPARAAVALVAAGAVALCAAGLLAPPRTSDDMYRYAWDGRVQAAGVSPYADPPDSAHLARLRDRWLFPAGACHAWDLRRTPTGVCTHINRPSVHTIYPPVAEGWYLAVHALSPAGARCRPFQIAGALLALAVTGALLWICRRRGLDPRRAAWWAWCPAVALGAVNDAHVDTLGVLLTVAALGAAAGTPRGAVLRGAAAGGAIAVKLLPVLALPGALAGAAARGTDRRRPALLVLSALAVVAASYLPYVAASGAGVIGYLPGYLQQEGYDRSSVGRFALLRTVLPDSWAGPAAALAVAAAAVYVLRRGDPRRPWSGALSVYGIALLATSPAYYWYALVIAALAALDGRWEWLAVPAACTALYLEGALGGARFTGQATTFALAATVIATGSLLRARAAISTRTTSPPAPLADPGTPQQTDGQEALDRVD